MNLLGSLRAVKQAGETYLIITTSYQPTEGQLAKAKEAADRLEARFVPRRKFSIPQLMDRYHTEKVILVGKDGLKAYLNSEPPVFFHPSTAFVRAKRILRGEIDIMLQAAGISAGDSVLDCTAGLASDSIVFSLAAGEQGNVISLESEQLLSFLVEEGLKSYVSSLEPVNQAMRRIQILHRNHYDYLKEAETASVDIVYFDPMFRQPIEESSGIYPLRRIANPKAVDPDSIREALRVARKCVVLKEHRDSGEFERLGFSSIIRSNTKIAYGVILCIQ